MTTDTLPVTTIPTPNQNGFRQHSYRRAKPADFALIAENFDKQLNQRKGEGSTRPQLTKRLQELDKKIDSGIGYIKNYISEEVGKENAHSYFLQFGIVKVGKNIKLPNDRNKRIAALDTLLAGIAARGYKIRTYGITYWQPIVNEYREKVAHANMKDSAISGQVSEKNRSKIQIRKTLNALVLLIKANYPDTYAAELRKWGFQKEKY